MGLYIYRFFIFCICAFVILIFVRFKNFVILSNCTGHIRIGHIGCHGNKIN